MSDYSISSNDSNGYLSRRRCPHQSGSQQNHSDITELLRALDIAEETSTPPPYREKNRSPYKDKSISPYKEDFTAREVCSILMMKLAERDEQEDMRRNKKDFDRLMHFAKELCIYGKSHTKDDSILLDALERARDDASEARYELRKAKEKNNKLKDVIREMMGRESNLDIRKLQEELSSLRKRLLEAEEEMRLLRGKLAQKDDRIDDQKRFYRDQIDEMKKEISLAEIVSNMNNKMLLMSPPTQRKRHETSRVKIKEISPKDEELMAEIRKNSITSKDEVVNQMLKKKELDQSILWDELSALSEVDCSSYRLLKSIEAREDTVSTKSLSISLSSDVEQRPITPRSARSITSHLPMLMHDRLSNKLQKMYVNK